MLYRVTFIHKISQRCSCTHPQGSHFEYDDDMKWVPGPCTTRGCKCTAFEHEYDKHELPSQEIEAIPPRPDAIAKVLREHKLLMKGQRLRTAYRNGPKLVCFPQASIWHSIIITKEEAVCEKNRVKRTITIPEDASFHELYQVTGGEWHAMPTIEAGWDADLKYQSERYRVWYSRMSPADYLPEQVADGTYSDERVQIETLVNGRWEKLDRYGRTKHAAR